MVDTVERVEFYYDSGVSDPKEDPAAIRDRIERLAERRGIEYEFVDLAEREVEDWSSPRSELVTSVRPGREYDVDGRVFTDETFGRHRPALVVRYGEDVDGIDLYPHRGDGSGVAVTRIEDFLDELDAASETDRSDREGLSEADESGRADSGQGELDSAADDGPVSRRSVLAGVAGAGAIGAGVVFVGLENVPVVGAYVDCGPGETEIASVDGEATGSTVEIMGTVDYSLDDSAAFTAFRLDGQTGTIPVFLDGESDSELGFGDCLTVRGEVQSGESRSVDGPVVADATVLDQ